MFEKIDGQAPETFPTDTTENHSQLSSAEEKQASTTKPTETQQIGQPAIRKSTGPRTPQGKERTKHNAVKHGIFSDVVLLKGESRADYQSLRRGLWKSRQPEDELEKLLVEKLVSIAWRYRRWLVAEGAEIRKRSEFLEVDRLRIQEIEAEEVLQGRPAGVAFDIGFEPAGLIWKIHNPDVLKHCLELLVKLRQRIKTDGLDEEQDGSLLKTIYGDSARPHLRRTLHDEYLEWLETAKATEEDRLSEEFATPEQCKQEVLRQIGAEVTSAKKFHSGLSSGRTKSLIQRGERQPLVPRQVQVNRIIRG